MNTMVTFPPIKITGPFTRETRVCRFRRVAGTYWRATRLNNVVEGGSPEGAENTMRDEIADALARLLGTEIRDARKMVDEMIGVEHAPDLDTTEPLL